VPVFEIPEVMVNVQFPTNQKGGAYVVSRLSSGCCPWLNGETVAYTAL